ncbi:MAG: hypothetical protein K0R73_1346 [Candidatus Midichloriaceae bacterium]|jgi:hypothetical protein|nr:hypothetical protein [Candidatus Midichloriaceae bacterium]
MSWYNPLSWPNDLYYWWYCTPAIKAAVDKLSADEGTLDFIFVKIPVVSFNKQDVEYVAANVKSNPYLKTLYLNCAFVSQDELAVIYKSLKESSCEKLIVGNYTDVCEVVLCSSLDGSNVKSLGIASNVVSYLTILRLFKVAKQNCFSELLIASNKHAYEEPILQQDIEILQKFISATPWMKVYVIINDEQVLPAEEKVEQLWDSSIELVGKYIEDMYYS